MRDVGNRLRVLESCNNLFIDLMSDVMWTQRPDYYKKYLDSPSESIDAKDNVHGHNIVSKQVFRWWIQ